MAFYYTLRFLFVKKGYDNTLKVGQIFAQASSHKMLNQVTWCFEIKVLFYIIMSF